MYFLAHEGCWRSSVPRSYWDPVPVCLLAAFRVTLSRWSPISALRPSTSEA